MYVLSPDSRLDQGTFLDILHRNYVDEQVRQHYANRVHHFPEWMRDLGWDYAKETFHVGNVPGAFHKVYVTAYDIFKELDLLSKSNTYYAYLSTPTCRMRTPYHPTLQEAARMALHLTMAVGLNDDDFRKWHEHTEQVLHSDKRDRLLFALAVHATTDDQSDWYLRGTALDQWKKRKEQEAKDREQRARAAAWI